MCNGQRTRQEGRIRHPPFASIQDEAYDVRENDRVANERRMDIFLRSQLADKARARRRELAVTRAELASRLGIKDAQLGRWEVRLPETLPANVQALWEAMLRVPEGWLTNAMMPTPPIEHRFSTGHLPSEAKSVAAEIRAVGCWLSRHAEMKRTLRFEELTPNEQRNASIFAQRYGVHGEASSSFQAIADEFGLTRQRVFQIMNRMLEKTPGLKVSTPCLEELAASVEPLLPCSSPVLDAKFRPLLGDDLSVVGAERFAREVLGKSGFGLTGDRADKAASTTPSSSV